MNSVRRVAVASAFLLLLSSCVTPLTGMGGGAGQVASAQAVQALPRHKVGDRYTFVRNTNGKNYTDRVLSVSGEVISWRTGRTNNFVRYRNFILPKLKYETSTVSADLTVNTEPGLLWPLRTGDSAWFSADNRYFSKSAGVTRISHQKWKCATGPRQRVTVKAGTFDTVELACDRYSKFRNFLYGIKWYYAPSIDYYVLKVTNYPAKRGIEPVRYELVSYARGGTQTASRAAPRSSAAPATRPVVGGNGSKLFAANMPPSVRVEANKILQVALETQLDGRTVARTDAGGAWGVSVTPMNTTEWPSVSGGKIFCRTFNAVLTLGGQSSPVTGNACRDANKVWRLR